MILREWMRGIIVLASCEHHFMRVHENLVQHPSYNISIVDTQRLCVLFCLKLKVSITTEPIWFSILGKLHIGPVIVLGYLILSFKYWDGFKQFSSPLCPLMLWVYNIC